MTLNQNRSATENGKVPKDFKASSWIKATFCSELVLKRDGDLLVFLVAEDEFSLDVFVVLSGLGSSFLGGVWHSDLATGSRHTAKLKLVSSNALNNLSLGVLKLKMHTNKTYIVDMYFFPFNCKCNIE